MNERASQTIERLTAEALADLEIIRQQLEARQNEAATASVNWGHAGDVGHIAEQLENVRRFLTGDVK